MSLKIDDFDPVSDGDLRELWHASRDPFLRRVILEVVRYRRVIDKARAEAQQIDEALRQKSEGEVVGTTQSLVKRLVDEKIRLGAMGGRTVKLSTDRQYRGR